MIQPTSADLIRAYKAKGYQVHEAQNVDWKLNILGIRSYPAQPGAFADTIVLFYRSMGNWDLSYYPATTLPSDYYLRHPVEDAGTCVLKEGQYDQAYKIAMQGEGRNRQMGLCQSEGDVSVYQESARDGEMYFRNLLAGRFGINLIRGSRNGVFRADDKVYSTGAQVFADHRHFHEFMTKCKFSRTLFGNRFTYTLMNESDFR